MSQQMMWAAPASRAAITLIEPIVPPSVTSTVLPVRLPARCTACRPIDSGSAQASSPSEMSSVIGVSWRSPITKRSRNMPQPA